MKCLFCEEDIVEFDGEQDAYLVTTVKGPRKEAHVHVHGTIDDITLNILMIDAIIKECGLENYYTRNKGEK